LLYFRIFTLHIRATSASSPQGMSVGYKVKDYSGDDWSGVCLPAEVQTEAHASEQLAQSR